MSRIELQDRFSAHSSIRFQHHGEAVQYFETTFSKFLEQQEEIYVRRLQIREKTPIDIGWVKNPGTIFIQNKVGSIRPVKPTEEEKAQEAREILFVFLDEESKNPILVRPQDSVRLEVLDPPKIFLQSASGNAIPCTSVVISR